MTDSCDVLVVGGGVLGLWAALRALQAGFDVALVDKGRIGGGGSNGLLGALLPHLPNAGNDKKRFQWQALAELPELVAGLQATTGLAIGYRQCGRLMPIRRDGYRKRLQRCVEEAPRLWQLAGRGYRFDMIDGGAPAGWIDTATGPLGFAADDLSARASPRLMTAALRAAIAPRARLVEGFDFVRFDAARGRATASDGRELVAKHVVLAAGYATYSLLRGLTGADLGSGVKGHSALFRLANSDALPILYDDGVYVVPHDGGYVAVGSTALDTWDDPDRVVADDCASFIDRARVLCPPLRGIDPVQLWAGVRPRSHAKDPICGRLFEGRDIHVLTGGFKISFGIAHRLAQALIDRLAGVAEPLPLPASYEVAYHLAAARDDGRPD